MFTDSETSDCDSPCDDLSWDEARELLDEVRDAMGGTDQHDLHEFVCLLSQVVDLHDPHGKSSSEERELTAFMAASLQEMRLLISEGKSDSQRMRTLRDQAIDRWGERLVPPDQDNLDESAADADRDWETVAELQTDSDDAAVAPSAEEVQALLAALNGPSDEESETVSPQALGIDPNGRTAFAAVSSEETRLAPQPMIASLDPELREAFLDDARVCVSSMEEALMRLESDPLHGDSLNQICRDLHTLKGASGSVGLTTLADQLHALEDSLRDDQTAGRSSNIDSLLRTVDSIREQISAQDVTKQPDNGCLGSAELQDAEFPADDESVRVKSSQLNRLMDMLAELVMLRNRRETEVSQLQDVYHELIGSVSKMRLLSNEERGQDAARSSLQLSEVANDVLEVAQNLRDCARPVAEGNAAVSQFIRQFRQELVELRRTPIAGLFQRLQRAVRDAAQTEAKNVRLRLVGEHAGIERALQQRLYEPLLHIVRNSVCHGIESSAERSQCGKDPTGTITLEATSTSDLFVIEIQDDGRGLDYDAIRRRGIESGLLSSDQAVSREELAQLIFQPGFSTRSTANQVAGRGVGMDVVAATLRRMRGWLEVESQPQQGTRIRLSFPLPSVIQHAMVFRSAGQFFALPMQAVKSAGEPEREGHRIVFSQILGVQARNPEGANEDGQRIVLAYQPPGSADASPGDGYVTLLVDEIIGPEEVVVRPLPWLMRNHPFCCGASLSGMGKTVLLLDARRLVESQHRHMRGGIKLADRCDASRAGEAQPARPHILVVDDSLSARKRVVRSLERYAVDVTEACDGRQALALLKTQTFAAVFSDLEMPHVSGMELLAELSATLTEDAPPVVIISSRGEEEYTGRAKELGASSYLIKPLADEALDGALSDIPTLRHLTNNPLAPIPPSGEVR